MHEWHDCTIGKPQETMVDEQESLGVGTSASVLMFVGGVPLYTPNCH